MFLSTDNQFTAQGRLVREGLVNITDNGNVICSITLAQKTPFRTNGENEVAYITYTAIDTKNNDIASRLAKYTTKGSLVSLVGYFDSYVKENKNGENEYHQVNRISSFRNEETKEMTEKRRKMLEGKNE